MGRASVFGHKITKKGQVVTNLYINDIPSSDLVGSEVGILAEVEPVSFRRAGSGYVELTCDFHEDGDLYQHRMYLDMMSGAKVEDYLHKKMVCMLHVKLIDCDEDGVKFLVGLGEKRFWLHRDRVVRLEVSNHTGTCVVYQKEYKTTARGRWDFDRCGKKN
ncbi:hypothetical protein [Bacillus mycoides]|uniref:hypothetical protein n=1 Tax=Bacillus mycoides TaxID=1405 RepID=UPI003A805CFF